MRLKFLLTVFFVMVVSECLFAAVPHTINYQGHLATSGGAPVNAAVDMTFTIYNAATNGTNLWTENQTVQVNNGIYAVALGAINSIDPAIIDGDLWLGVKVGSDVEMAPRQKLNSVLFALKAATVADPILEVIKMRAKGDYSYFVDNGDETISDPFSGLMIRKGLITNVNWYVANGIYDVTNNPSSLSACGDLSTAGFNDWRTPNVHEIQQILPDLGKAVNSSIQLILTPLTVPGTTVPLWTSDEDGAQPEYGLAMHLSTHTFYEGLGPVPGASFNRGFRRFSKTSVTPYHVMCVRD